MTFPGDAVVHGTVNDILSRSWLVYEGYTSPMGIGFIISQDNPYGCAPKTNYTHGGGQGGKRVILSHLSREAPMISRVSRCPNSERCHSYRMGRRDHLSSSFSKSGHVP